jgi:hypothetical protein
MGAAAQGVTSRLLAILKTSDIPPGRSFMERPVFLWDDELHHSPPIVRVEISSQ